jgi:hypothetical protein
VVLMLRQLRSFLDGPDEGHSRRAPAGRRPCRVVTDEAPDLQPPPREVGVELLVDRRTDVPYVVVSFDYDDAPGRIGFPLPIAAAEEAAMSVLGRIDQVRANPPTG